MKTKNEDQKADFCKAHSVVSTDLRNGVAVNRVNIEKNGSVYV